VSCCDCSREARLAGRPLRRTARCVLDSPRRILKWLKYPIPPDLRAPSSKQTAQLRSINLAISHRGLAAIQVIDPPAAQRFLQTVIPMKGRMVHHPNGSQESQLYDRDGQVGLFLHSYPFFPSIGYNRPAADLCPLVFLFPQCINSIDRALLNESLLDEASSSPNIRLFFQHKVQFVDFDKKIMTVLDVPSGAPRSIEFDFCIGADGSYSVIRRQMMKVIRHVQAFF
jgi:kynurenine 3-monooxygenase